MIRDPVSILIPQLRDSIPYVGDNSHGMEKFRFLIPQLYSIGCIPFFQ